MRWVLSLVTIWATRLVRLRVEQGKAARTATPCSRRVLLECLRAWWRVAHAQSKIFSKGWLFTGLNPMNPLSARQLNRAIRAGADAAGIDKRVSMHSLSFRVQVVRGRVLHEAADMQLGGRRCL